MMLMPRRDFDLFGDDFFRDDFFKSEKNNLMKTDIKETEDSYILLIHESQLEMNIVIVFNDFIFAVQTYLIYPFGLSF